MSDRSLSLVWCLGRSDPSLAGVSRLGRSEGARWWGVSTTFVVGSLLGWSGDVGFVPGGGVGSDRG